MNEDATRPFALHFDLKMTGRSRFLVVMLLILAILAVYWPVQHYSFIDFDDQVYVTDNRAVREGLTWGGMVWALKSLDAGFWQPLTWLSLMADYSLFGLNAGGYHWTNLLLHVAATLLLYSVLRQMTGAFWRSLFVAALFALHPLHVEPVAWIAARKDVLSAFFWMLTMQAYVLYVRKPDFLRYVLVNCAFMLGLMSKTMAATLPFVLLLLDYWPLGRFPAMADPRFRDVLWRLLKEKSVPLLLAVVVVLLTFEAEHKAGALKSLVDYPLDVRLATAVVSYAGYILKTLWPFHLAASYPHPGQWPLWQVAGSGLLLLMVSYGVFFPLRRFRYLAVGWLWYLGALVPVIGLIQIGSHFMADRYTYLPLIGVFIMIAWGVPDLLMRYRCNNAFLILSALALLVFLGAVSRMQVQTWSSNFSFFRHVLEVTGENQRGHHGLGMAYHAAGDREKSIHHLQEALRIKPDERTHNDLGFVYMAAGQYRDAEKEFRSALALRPDNARTRNNLGAALASQGRHEEAAGEFREALRLDPRHENARSNLERVIRNMQAPRNRAPAK
jgi:hypothetical protein